MRDFKRDAVKIGLSMFAGAFGIPLLLVLIGVGLTLAFTSCRSKPSPAISALRDTIRLSDSVYVTRTDTVVEYQRRVDTVKARSDSTDARVGIVDSVTVRVADTVAVVPGEVVANISALRLTVATQDTLIRSLYGRDSTQEWRIATRDRMLRELSKQAHPLCGRRCGFVLGVGTSILVFKAVK